ncbi:lysine transporter LysE [Paenibacillus montaniterrae]|uniref:Lysine transporter LysE n=1 Tax=Paenibacillus montaniterrae TaxID=429341 RepID=A0A920CUV7_9BACL|nr:LysE family translocator [Paenibacillus montaniterrae]GIP17437.1 lysine transporter LysE [Paenibacillus montaniterrae]
MTATILLKGVIIGFAIAAPVGPVGVICIRRSLAQGGLYGFVSGLGAATADAIYGCIAAFGFAWLTNLLIGYQMWLQLCGGMLLLWMGWRTWRSRPADLYSNAEAEAPRKKMLAAYASVLAITLTNPMTILAFAGIIAGAGIAVEQQLAGPALLLVGGVFSGSLLWWLFLSSAASLFRKKLKPGGLLWINRLSGVIIVGYGLWALFTA